ncbi:MAG TPA: diacylglycerol kinase family protein [Oscillospiraceae bacterium]|nr:diacylglycerol kinase family protein [Oscillospiraceae bacterium]
MYFNAGKKVLLIINPTAGKKKLNHENVDIADLLRKKGYTATALETEKKGDATDFVKQHAGNHDIIVCCGGDGTLNEIITGLMQSNSQNPIGYIPTGTTNDMAKTLRLPKNIKKATHMIWNGEPIDQDVGIFNDTQYFSYIASFGAFTKVSYATPQWLKNRFGHAAYVIDGIKSVGDIHPYQLKVTSDGIEEEGEFIFGSVTNSCSVGGTLQFKKEDVCLNDGKFEVLLVRNPRNPIELRSIIYGVLHKKYDEKHILFLHANQVTFQFDKETPWTVDGEFAGEPQTVCIENLHNAVKFIRNQ